MSRVLRRLTLLGPAILLIAGAGCDFEIPEDKGPSTVIFVGVDASGSFKNSGYYNNSIDFLAQYLHAHFVEAGGLARPKALFVGTVGGKRHGEPKTFHPIHDFDGKSVTQIRSDLKSWFTADDTLTDFNSFFAEVARITKERNLVLSPITIMMVTDGIPDAVGVREGSDKLYKQIDLKPLEYLSRNTTIRMAYVSPTVAKKWRTLVPRERVRLWTIDAQVMKRWKEHMEPNVAFADQEKFWEWMRDNVNFPIRATKVY